MVKNPPSNAGDAGLIPGGGGKGGGLTKIPHATGQLSPCATTPELMGLNGRVCVPQTTEPTRSGARVPQPERETPARLNEEPSCLNKDPACLN